MISGLFETHINVLDLERSMRFYTEKLGLELGYLDREDRIALYWVGGPGETMLGVREKPVEQVQPQHFAFRCSVEDVLEHAVPFLRERGLEPHNILNDGTERPLVFGWMPALAIYFRDPDGHLLELLAMLPEAPRPEVGVVSWEEWKRLSG